MKESEPSVENHYDAIADAWETFTQAPWKAELLWPTTRSLLPEVGGKRVLDAGCGNGTYSNWLAERGADVVGIDASREMIEVARREHGDSAEFQRVDLDDIIPFSDDRFDLVLSQHVFSHLPDLEGPITEFARTLESGGSLVVSTHNPVHDFLVVWDRDYPETSAIDGMELDPVVDPDPERPTYHDTEQFEIYWNGPESSNPGAYYRRSVSELLQPLLDAGFALEELVEPDLRDVWEERDPDVPSELFRRPPRSICYRAMR
ncbi:class I SAM-dependent methyltransferase [Halosolutus gelatinilyticus]|uniref:class I SAM-dependent methyltransferase n=1 Tax=Halosolutus gelatinilyticus TaxID=2931975 RepID=UPI001FF6AD9D|nr:class I SAM-dependent methyltransferase [Halosolutus gelatinilyticus]